MLQEPSLTETEEHIFCLMIHGTSLRIHTNSFCYFKYLKIFLGPLEQNLRLDTDIEVFLNLTEMVKPSPSPDPWIQSDGLKRIGRRIMVSDNEVVCDGINQLTNLKLRCVYEEKTKIYAYLNLTKSRFLTKRFYQQIIKRKQFDYYKYDVYATLTYYLIYYPLLYRLEQKNIYPLHASAVECEGRKILMPGLPGVGKSTLSLAFLATINAKFLSDNIVLYDANRVYSFFEPLKLDAYGISLAGLDVNFLVKIGTDPYYHRSSFRIKEEHVLKSMQPNVLLIPVRSSETILAPISPQQATQMSCDFNFIAGEINSYLSYLSIQNLCPQNKPAQNRIKHLRTLYDSMDCFLLYVKSGQPLNKVIKIIESSW